jgi:hypothetical protein
MQGGKRWPVAVTKRFVAHHLQATHLGDVLGCTDVGHGKPPCATGMSTLASDGLATVNAAGFEPVAEPRQT